MAEVLIPQVIAAAVASALILYFARRTIREITAITDRSIAAANAHAARREDDAEVRIAGLRAESAATLAAIRSRPPGPTDDADIPSAGLAKAGTE